MKIIKYEVIIQASVLDLNYTVAQKMKEDWQPLGGVSAFDNGSKNYFLQAIVKYSEE